MRELAGLFKALADETRLEMLALLVQREELCVCRFEEALDITQSKASRHLRYLLNAGLLADRRDGVWVHYRIAADLPSEQAELLKALPHILGEERMGRAALRLAEGDEARAVQAAVGCSPATSA